MMNCNNQKRCEFFLYHKARCCRFHVVAGESFCGLHLHAATGQGKKRIPCPIDPRQCVQRNEILSFCLSSVVEEELEKHLLKCAALRQRSEQEVRKMDVVS